MSPRRNAPPALALALAALLAACGAPVAARPPTAIPTPAPAPTAPPPAEPTPAPTAPAAAVGTPAPVALPTPAPTGALPQPLYLLLGGQIFRLERDGVTRTQITYEVPFEPGIAAIAGFAVSPADGTLAYVVQRVGPSVLVRAGPDGEGPTPIFDRDGVQASYPVFSPDGALVAARLVALPEGDPSFQSGVYLIPAAGGEPQLLIADDPDAGPETPAFGHQPLAFAPDGSRLLLNRFALFVEQCDLALVAVPGGAVTPIQPPPPLAGERQTTCDAGVWASDGSAVYVAPIRIGALAGATAIWRVDAETGASQPITPLPDGAPFTLYVSPGAAPDGSLLAFIAQADALPEPFSGEPSNLAYSMARIDPTDGTAVELRPAVEETPLQVVWDGAGRGAAAILYPRDPVSVPPSLYWLPADGGEPILLLQVPTDLMGHAWSS